MNVSIVHSTGVVPLSINPSDIILTVKALIEHELNIPSNQQLLLFKNQPLNDNQSVQEQGIQHDDVIEVRRIPVGASANTTSGTAIVPSSSSSSSSSTPPRPTLENIPAHLFQNPAALQTYFRNNPDLIQQLLNINPPLAQAVLADGPEQLTRLLNEQERRRRQQAQEEAIRIAMLNADPFDPQAQARIEEMIRQKNVEENWEAAMEHNPAAFARVIMLYVPMVVNGVKLAAFVDSGAQSTIMSVECAQRCNLMRLCDTRYAGLAKGVGTAKILGRVHQAAIQIGSVHLVCSFTIIENQGMEFLLGLDQLKQHQAVIDLKDNCLRIHDQAIPFMAEKDLPAHLKQENHDMEDEKKATSSTSSSSASTSTSTSTSTSSSSSSSSSSSPSSTSTSTSSGARSPATTTTAAPRSPAATSPSPAPLPTAQPQTRPTATPSPTPAPLMPNIPGVNPALAQAFASALAQMAQQGAGGGAGQGARPAGGPAPSAARPLAAAAPAAGAHSPEKIAQITALGFTPAQAVQALTLFGGNVEAAASFLFQEGGQIM